ncbi:MAG: hypothetical protein K8S55_07315 [Phycisphaerae bacterium]|nr:hypothetical protein [Phycisphaerae bacterium]
MKTKISILLILAGASAMSSLSGCAAFAYLATLFTPPKTIKPEYEIPKDKTILVLVDDPSHLAQGESIRYELTRQLNKDLVASCITEDVISYHQLRQLMVATPEFHNLSNTEIAKKIGADIVLYVQIREFSLKDHPSSPVWQGNLRTTIRVVGAEEGTLWPEDSLEGYDVKKVSTPRETHEYIKNAGRKLTKTLAEDMSCNIINLFIEHKGRDHHDLPEKDVEEQP